jgi:hypothetical protein
MANKDETIAVRVTEQKRGQTQEWAEKHGMTEADAVRHAVHRLIYDQKRLEEISEQPEIQAKLESIEAQIAEISVPWWRRIFLRGVRGSDEQDADR